MENFQNSSHAVTSEATTPKVTEDPDIRRWDDATWILTSAFIIFTMQSGFGLLESGSASRKNEVNIMVKNAVDVLFGGISYWMFGFGFSFGKEQGSGPFIGIGYFFVDTGKNDDQLGHLFSLFFFQASFATTATTIVSGSMAERTKLEAYILFSFLNTFIYCIPAHWIWSPEHGWLRQLGATDIAGASAVHLVGGVTGLIATMMLGPRTGRFEKEGESPKMSSPTNAIFGLFMLWWGWLGFNCGSTYGITEKKWVLATRSAVSTITSSIGGGMVGIGFSYITKKYKFDIVYIIDGILGALVSITESLKQFGALAKYEMVSLPCHTIAYCALARPWEGLVIGAIGGLITCLSVPLIEKLKIDDPVGVIPVHFIAAIWSMLSVGLFGEVDQLEDFLKLNGLFRGGGFKLLGIQVLAVLIITFWTAVVSYIILKILDLTIGLRVPLHEEILGADIVEHSINGSYDKASGEWNDSEGRLIMIVDRSNPENYERTIRELKYHMREDAADNVWVRRSSFMGFSRSQRPSRSQWEEPQLVVDRSSDKSSGFESHSPHVMSISVPNGIEEEVTRPSRRRSSDGDGIEVLVIPSVSMERNRHSGEFWSEDIVKQLRRKGHRGKRGNSR